MISLPYEYNFKDDGSVSVGDFLDETVRITLDQYCKAPIDEKHRESDRPDFISDKSDMLVSCLQIFTEKDIEEKAASGKIAFGVHYNTGKISPAKACENTRQCFADGLIALFVDGDRYNSLTDTIRLKEGSQITFIKLTFLSGRIW